MEPCEIMSATNIMINLTIWFQNKIVYWADELSTDALGKILSINVNL